MAHLLMMFQKFRLLRERNMEQLNMTRATSKLSRIEKNIKNKQKYYTSLFTNLDNQAKNMKAYMQNSLRNSWGFDMNSTGGSIFGGMLNGFSANRMMGYMTKGFITTDKDGKEQTNMLFENNQAQAEAMISEYYGNNCSFKEGSDYTEDQQKLFNQIRYRVQQEQQQAQQMMSEQSQIMQNNVDIWLEAAKEQLEAEQDSVIDALTYEQTMMELDKEYSENRLNRINSEIESYDAVIKESVKDVPKFGLG